MLPGLRCPAAAVSGKFWGGSCARVFRERRVMPRFVAERLWRDTFVWVFVLLGPAGSSRLHGRFVVGGGGE